MDVHCYSILITFFGHFCFEYPLCSSCDAGGPRLTSDQGHTELHMYTYMYTEKITTEIYPHNNLR